MEPGVVRDRDGIVRCWWAAGNDLYAQYHDEEWGFPVADDRRLFEKICLEGFQSGLSWITILRKRENFRAAFSGFDFDKVARYGSRQIEKLVNDAGIVRHRGKIESTINNARRARELHGEYGSLARYFWQWERRIDTAPTELVPTSAESIGLSKDLKKRGWTFVGPTTMYAFMQAVGLVNDHLQDCPIRERAKAARERFSVP